MERIGFGFNDPTARIMDLGPRMGGGEINSLVGHIGCHWDEIPK